MFVPKKARKPRPPINIVQRKFNKGYVSTLSDSRIPNDGLADALNITLEQDGLPRPRPSLVRYGEQPLGTMIGMGKFTKIVSGLPEYWEISMQDIGGTGKVHIRKDGDAWEAIVDADNSYSSTAWTTFTQANSRVYISNGTNNMSYYDINAGTITAYSSLATPGAPTVTQTGLAGATYTMRYKISANNAAGESIASTAGTVTVTKLRDVWNGTSEYVDVTWSSVAGAVSYNVYWGDTAGYEYYLTTVTGLSFRDDSSIAPNTFRLYPAADSSTGPKLTNLYNKNSQLFGVGDVNNPSYLWYSGAGTEAGDFSPFNGGGYVPIDLGGDTVPVAVRSFHDGKGTSALTVLTRGGGRAGKVYHVVFNTTTYGETVIVYPEVYEANGQAGTSSPHAVVEINNNLIYPTGNDFKSTGTKPNLVNILATDSIAQALENDLTKLNLAAMDGAVGMEYQGKAYFALPVGASSNNEVWVYDTTRNGLWILRWTVSAKWMWVYEDNSGTAHHCVLTSDNVVLEFSRAVATADDGVAFRTNVKGNGLTFDEAGDAMASIEFLRFKFLYPRGDIDINISGIGEDGPTQTLAATTITTIVPRTGFSNGEWSGPGNIVQWSETPEITTEEAGEQIHVEPVEVDEILNQATWEISTEAADTDYILSSVLTTGKAISGLYYGD